MVFITSGFPPQLTTAAAARAILTGLLTHAFMISGGDWRIHKLLKVLGRFSTLPFSRRLGSTVLDDWFLGSQFLLLKPATYILDQRFPNWWAATYWGTVSRVFPSWPIRAAFSTVNENGFLKLGLQKRHLKQRRRRTPEVSTQSFLLISKPNWV